MLVTANQIEAAGRKADFVRQPLADRLRIIFRRGFNFLNVHLDGRWAFYANLCDGRKPDTSGSDLESLSVFLTTPTGKPVTRTRPEPPDGVASELFSRE